MADAHRTLPPDVRTPVPSREAVEAITDRAALLALRDSFEERLGAIGVELAHGSRDGAWRQRAKGALAVFSIGVKRVERQLRRLSGDRTRVRLVAFLHHAKAALTPEAYADVWARVDAEAPAAPAGDERRDWQGDEAQAEAVQAMIARVRDAGLGAEAGVFEAAYWGLHRLMGALQCALPYVDDHPDHASPGGVLSVVRYTADHWAPRVPGVPVLANEAVRRADAADRAWHDAEDLRLRREAGEAG